MPSAAARLATWGAGCAAAAVLSACIPLSLPTATGEPLAVTALTSIGTSQQVVLVTTSGLGVTTATVETFEQAHGRWRRAFPVMHGFVGRGGVSNVKREGDGTTPAGTYLLGPAFGTAADPGAHVAYERVGPDDVWVDDPASDRYNLRERGPSQNPPRWVHAESLYQPGPYEYAVVIAYNTARVPGAGSAIFLHVSTDRPTVGCVAIPRDDLIAVLRWLHPARRPVIVITTTAELATR